MWDAGINPRRSKFEGVNEEILSLRGHLDSRTAQRELYKFLRANPTFACDLLFGVKLFPFQHMAMKAILEGDYNLFVWGRGMSKTFSSALGLMLYAIMNQGVKIGLLSSSFRQSRLLLGKIDDILAKPAAALGRGCMTSNPRRQPDIWTYEFGESQIIALPMGSGEKLRGFRFNMICIDEFLLMPPNIYNEVILPFLGVAQNPDKIAALNRIEDDLIKQGKMTVEDKHVWPSNKLLMLSSASYKFEYLYKLYQTFEGLILEGKERNEHGEWIGAKDKASRCIMHFSHEIVPPEIYDENMISQARSTMSEAQFAREFGAVFTDESDGYFRLSTIQQRCISNECTEIKGEEGAEYILSIDSSWSESGGSDDFAAQILKTIPGTEKSILVHSYAIPGQKLTSHFNYILYILTNFNIKLIIFDRNGGDVFMQAFNEYAPVITEGINLKAIDVDFEDPVTYDEDLRKFNNLYNKLEWKICIQRKPTATWIRTANELMQSRFDHGSTLFARVPEDTELVKQFQVALNGPIGLESLNFDRKAPNYKDMNAKKVDFVEIQHENIEATKTQIACIVVKITDLGTQQFGLPTALKKTSGSDKARKDSYSAMLLGVWGHKIYVDANSERAAPIVSTFTPFFIR